MTITVAGERRKPLPGASAGRPRISVGHSLPPERGARQPKAAERVAGDIVHDIVARGMRTGDHLPLEAQMVDEYGASRASVREALRLLEVQGLLHLKPGPGGGPVVGQVDPANLARTTSLYFHLGGATYDSALRTQMLLEPVCAQLAARHPLRHATMERYLVAAAPRTTDDYRRHARRLPRRDLPARRQPDHRPAHPGDHPHRHGAAGGDDGPRRAAGGRPATSTPGWPGRSPAVSRTSPAA